MRIGGVLQKKQPRERRTLRADLHTATCDLVALRVARLTDFRDSNFSTLSFRP